MKLRLPHKLQTALLTAFASVTFTTIGTATLAAAQGDASPAASVTSTGFVVSEEALEVDLGEEEEEESTEPDSAPINEAGFNGIPGNSDEVDRALSVSVSEGGTGTTPAAGTVSGQGASVSEATVAEDLGFTTQVTDGTAPAASSPVFQMAAAPAAQQVQAVETATQENTANTTFSTESSDSTTSPLGSDTTGWGIYDPYYYGYLAAPAPVLASAPMLGAAGSANSIVFTPDASGTGGTFEAGNWRRHYNSTATEVGTSNVEATRLLTTRLQVQGNTNATNLSDHGGDIVVGNGGQLFLQTWNAANISLANNILIGASTYMDGQNQMGTIRFGNDGGHTTTLGGNIYLIEDSSFYASTDTNASNAIYLNGTVTDLVDSQRLDNTLTIKQGKLYHFHDIDLSGLTLNNGVVMDYTGTATVGRLNGTGSITGTGLTINTAEGESAEYSGTLNLTGGLVKNGEGTQTLSAANTIAGGVTVNAGTLVAQAANSLGSADATVNTDGTLVLATENGMPGITGSGTVKITDGDFQYHSATFLENFEGKVLIADGGLVQVGNYGTKFAKASTLEIGTGGTLKGWGTTFTKDITLTGGTLSDAGNNETYSGAIHVTGNATSRVTHSDGHTVTLTGNITVDEGAGLAVNGNIAMSGAEATFDINGSAVVNGTVNATAGTITVAGEASFASLNMGGSSTAEVVVKDGGILTLSQFSKSGTSKLTLERGGKADLRGKVWVEGLEGGGAVLGTGTCSIDSADVTLKNVAVSAQGRVDIGNRLEGSTLTVDSYVTLNNAANTLTSTTVNSAWLDVKESMQLGDVTVTGGELRLTNSSGQVTMASGTIGAGGTLTLSRAEQFIVDGGAFTFDSGAILDLSALNITAETPLTLATATGGGSFTEHNLGNIVFNFGAEIEHDNARLVVDGNALKLTFVQPQTDVLYWKGGPGVWDYREENWHPSSDTSSSVAFTDGKNLVFSTPGDSMVTITETQITTGDVVVEKGVNLDLSSNGTALDAQKVDVKGNLTVSNVAVTADSLNIERGSRVTADVEGTRQGALATDVSGAGDVVKKGTGTLTLTGDNAEFSGTVTIEQGTLIAGGNAGTALGGSPNVVLNGGKLEGNIAPGGDINITSAKEEATVSANIEVAAGKALTFNTDAGITLTSSGTISGAGDICKSGTGTLVLDTANTFTGDLNINAGTVLVSNVGALGSENTQNVTVGTGSNLVFASGDNAYSADHITLDRGSKLTFSGAGAAGNPLLQINTLSLTSNSSMDFSNIQIDHYGAYVLASVETMDPAEEGIWKPDQTRGMDLVQFITMTGMNTAEGFNLSPDDLVSLHYNKNTKLLTLDVTKASQGYYWQPDREQSVWDTTTPNWKNNQGEEKTFVNQPTTTAAMANSAYFLEAGEDNVEKIQLGIDYIFLHDLVVANGEYTFTFDYPQAFLNLDVNQLSNFVVRSGAKAHFENAAVFGSGENTVAHICTGAEATMDGLVQWETYSVNNEGTYIVEFDPESYFAAGIMGHVDNTGTMSVSIKASNAESWFMVGEVMNREGATMVLALPTLYPDSQYGNGAVHNMGDLTYGIPDEGVEGTMYSPLPIDGTGIFKTKGEGLTIQQDAIVEQSALELGAGLTEISGLVTVSDSTTVKSGATAVLSAGGTLGKVTLESGATLQLEGDGTTPEIYRGGTAVAGAGSVLKVDEDASLTLDSYNAGAPATGAIVVGGGSGNPALLTVEGVTNAASLTVYDGEAHLHGGGTIASLTQSGGTARFCSDAYLGGGTVSGGTLLVEDGKELTVGSVINVTGGSYTVADTAGVINASALELVKSMDNIQYHEAVSGAATENQSGFLSGGEQHVKVFDLQNNATLTPNGATVIHKDAAAPMTLNDEGIGYLDTSETVYASYYVRDNYVAGVPDSRVPNYVKLSDVMEASKNGGTTPQLETVVFDTTTYNEGKPVTGSLTVDVQGQHADLFDVKTGAVGVVSIGNDASGARVMLCCCEEFGSVDGQMLIAGTGIYQLENRGTLGGNVSLLAETKEGIGPWTGTVRITGSGEDLVMAPLAVGSGENASEIEFSHWSGSFEYKEEEPVVSNAKILLTGNGVDAAPAITLTPGDADMVWTNTVRGDNGRINHGQAGDFNLLMTGDTSEWDGVFSQSAAETTVTLGFMDSVSESGTQSAEMQASNGTMNVTYGGNVKTVNGKATVFGQSDMSLAYTGTDMTVNGTITQFRKQGALSLTVGDGTHAASATFSGVFDSTDNATMTVEKGSTATIDTNAALLRVVGEEDSSVEVNNGKTLSLASTDAVTGYSRFYNLNNRGTIEMQASGGDIKLVDTTTEGKTYNLGALELTGTPGTAAIETSGVNGQTTNVNITALRGTTDVLELTNDNAAGTVNYNLGGAGSTAEFSGKIAYGVNGGNGAAADLVIKGDDVAANAVLETAFAASGDTAAANIVVDTAHAKVLGLSSDANSAANKTMVVSGTAGSANKVIEIVGNDTYTYAGKLGENLDVTYSGNGTQTIQGGVDGFRGAVKVESAAEGSGTLAIQNLMNGASVSITDLTIGASDTLDLNDGSNVGTAEVSGSVVAKGGPTTNGSGSASKLDGSLTLGSGATYDVSASAGTGGLQLTGALTITQGAQLSTNDLAGVLNLGWFGMYDLAFDVTDMSSFGEDVDWSEGVDASTVFGNEALGGRKEEFYIRYSQSEMGGNGNNVGAVYIYRIPEPATGTLSLLALCAFAARRRRK